MRSMRMYEHEDVYEDATRTVAISTRTAAMVKQTRHKQGVRHALLVRTEHLIKYDQGKTIELQGRHCNMLKSGDTFYLAESGRAPLRCGADGKPVRIASHEAVFKESTFCPKNELMQHSDDHKCTSVEVMGLRYKKYYLWRFHRVMRLHAPFCFPHKPGAQKWIIIDTTNCLSYPYMQRLEASPWDTPIPIQLAPVQRSVVALLEGTLNRDPVAAAAKPENPRDSMSRALKARLADLQDAIDKDNEPKAEKQAKCHGKKKCTAMEEACTSQCTTVEEQEHVPQPEEDDADTGPCSDSDTDSQPPPQVLGTVPWEQTVQATE
eukprot:NODE_255_length_1738_cov_172.380273.p1 GENE.NODE_255_length_1738_cov_172.380273~~NODE_255_length_1738_cov_172.380273.p1  ORF type:complete len:321 (+),score=42.82 NODE_255_length_1738_cov_172.380273:321-1283(+)